MRLDVVDGIRGHMMVGMMSAHLFIQQSVGTIYIPHHHTILGLWDAEFFFLIAGFLVGWMFRHKLTTPEKRHRFLLKRLKKILQYYVLSALPFIVAATFAIMEPADGTPVERFFWALIGVLTFTDGGFFSEILVFYFWCFLIVLAIVYLCGTDFRRILGIGAAFYLLSGLFTGGGLFGLGQEAIQGFDLTAWIFHFLISLAIGYYFTELDTFAAKVPPRMIYLLVGGTAAMTAVIIRFEPFLTYGEWRGVVDWFRLPHWPSRVELHPLYLFHIFAVSASIYLIMRARPGVLRYPAQVLEAYFKWTVLRTVGQYSIQMFTIHCYIVAAVMMTAEVYDIAPGAFSLLGTALVIAFLFGPYLVLRLRDRLGQPQPGGRPGQDGPKGRSTGSA
ncbi:MAG: acyltransferase family protein [Pseudomonadota bacterium]